MDQSLIHEILSDAMPDECQLRPDIAIAASRAAAEGTSLQLADTKHGDPIETPELIELIFHSALFISAVLNIVHKVQSIAMAEIDRRARAKEARTKDLPEHHTKLLIEKTKKRLP